MGGKLGPIQPNNRSVLLNTASAHALVAHKGEGWVFKPPPSCSEGWVLSHWATRVNTLQIRLFAEPPEIPNLGHLACFVLVVFKTKHTVECSTLSELNIDSKHVWFYSISCKRH